MGCVRPRGERGQGRTGIWRAVGRRQLTLVFMSGPAVGGSSIIRVGEANKATVHFVNR